jgi:LysM repeat protein
MRFYGDLVDDGGGYGDVPQSVQKAAITPAKPITVKVERGDTLSSIAKENKTTVSAILAANPKFTEQAKYKDGNMIWAGTTVKIPPKVSTPLKTATIETPVEKKEEKREEEKKEEKKEEEKKEEKKETKEEPPLVTGITTSTASYYSPGPAPLTPADITTASVAAALPPPPAVKTAPIDTVLFNDDGLTIEAMADLIFENIGGHELINIARNDIVNGQQVSYQPIKNLSSIQQQYNPNNILSVQSTSDKYFSNFPIKLENKIPRLGTGPNGKHIYIDSTNGNLIIEAVNVEQDEQIEIEITVSGTIYEAEFGEITS